MVDDALPLFNFAIIGKSLGQGFDQGNGAGEALFLEQRLGQIAPQGWQFYAITGTLFITFAFPGFIYRYLFRKHA